MIESIESFAKTILREHVSFEGVLLIIQLVPIVFH